jgi:hypothetical protein
MSELKDEIISTIKWTWLICTAGIACYIVMPKYQMESSGKLRLNQVTGDICLQQDIDDNGKLIFDTKKL